MELFIVHSFFCLFKSFFGFRVFQVFRSFQNQRKKCIISIIQSATIILFVEKLEMGVNTKFDQ